LLAVAGRPFYICCWLVLLADRFFGVVRNPALLGNLTAFLDLADLADLAGSVACYESLVY
jgi:hypothetical protein